MTDTTTTDRALARATRTREWAETVLGSPGYHPQMVSALQTAAVPELAAVAAAAARLVSVAPDWWCDRDYEQGDGCRVCGARTDAAGKRGEDGFRGFSLAHAPDCWHNALDAALAALGGAP